MTTPSAPSRGLYKAARTGVASSRMAQPPAEIANTDALDAVFGPGACASPEKAADEILDFAALAAEANARQDATAPTLAAAEPAAQPDEMQPPAAASAVGASSSFFSRMKKLVGADAPAAAPAAQEPPAASAPAPAVAPATPSPLQRLVKVASGDGDMKRHMASAKVLTPLVASVSFAPGSAASPAERTRALTDAMRAALEVSRRAAAAYEASAGVPVKEWVIGQLMQTASVEIARQVRHQGAPLSGEQVQAFAQSLAAMVEEQQGLVAELVLSAGSDAYEPCRTVNDAHSRMVITLSSCAWKAYDWVKHECLSMDPRGEHPSRFFTYGLPEERVVHEILRAASDQACAFIANVQNSDMRVAHLQASTNRFIELIGSEYVTRTRKVMNWIGQEGLTNAQALERSRLACAKFLPETLPKIIEHARSLFVFIESEAANIADGLNENLNELPAEHVRQH